MKSKYQELKRGILNVPRGTNDLVTVDKRGVMKISQSNKDYVKRPNQYSG